jgi:hypothetical protein
MEGFKANKISFRPLDLKKALVNKPIGSKISFKGIGNDALEFAMPARSMNFYDYVVMALLIGFFIVFLFVTYWVVVMGGWFSFVFPPIIWGGFLYAAYKELMTFKQTEFLEISNKLFAITRTKKTKIKRKEITLDKILLFRMNSLGPSVIYMGNDNNENEALFMEFSSRKEQEWIISILRSIVYNVTKKIV